MATLLNNLSDLLQTLDRAAEAEALIRRALAIDMRRIIELGERPPHLRSKEMERVESKEGVDWRLRQ